MVFNSNATFVQGVTNYLWPIIFIALRFASFFYVSNWPFRNAKSKEQNDKILKPSSKKSLILLRIANSIPKTAIEGDICPAML